MFKGNDRLRNCIIDFGDSKVVDVLVDDGCCAQSVSTPSGLSRTNYFSVVVDESIQLSV